MKPISNEAFHILVGQLELFAILSTRCKSFMKSMLWEDEFLKGARILSSGHRQIYIWFMLDGLAREVRVNELNFKERTQWFWLPFSFLYTTPGFFSGHLSYVTIEILMNCRVVLISFDNLRHLSRLFPEIDRIIEMIKDADTLSRLAHEEELRTLNTEARYKQKLSLMGKLFRLTKRRYIAEFMGMSVDRIGKLRNKF